VKGLPFVIPFQVNKAKSMSVTEVAKPCPKLDSSTLQCFTNQAKGYFDPEIENLQE